MTVAADTVAVNISFEGLLLMVLSVMKNGQNQYPFYDQNG